MQARVLTIAGSDCSGGAGIQADLKTISALGGYGSSAITALTVQNSRGVQGIFSIEAAAVSEQIEAVLEDIGADCIKIGMLHRGAIVRAVIRCLERYPQIPVVLDPVGLSSSGHSLLDEEGKKLIVDGLFPRASLLTPNLAEAAEFSGIKVDSVASMTEAASLILLKGPSAVLVKGGHLGGDEATDVLITADGELSRFESERILGPDYHGTGCTLSSAIAVGIAQGMTLASAILAAKNYLEMAMRSSSQIGKGAQPLNHGWLSNS